MLSQLSQSYKLKYVFYPNRSIAILGLLSSWFQCNFFVSWFSYIFPSSFFSYNFDFSISKSKALWLIWCFVSFIRCFVGLLGLFLQMQKNNGFYFYLY